MILGILTTLILSCSVAMAGQGMGPGPGVKGYAAASGGEVGNKSGTNDDTVTPSSYPGNDQGLSGCFVAGASGPIGYIHAQLNSSSGTTGQQYNAAINDASGNRIADGTMQSEPGTVPGRITFALDSPTTVTTSTTYCLTMGAHNSPDGWYLSTTNVPGSNVYQDSTYTVGDTMPSTVDVTTVRTSNYVLRIWATNTADGT